MLTSQFFVDWCLPQLSLMTSISGNLPHMLPQRPFRVVSFRPLDCRFNVGGEQVPAVLATPWRCSAEIRQAHVVRGSDLHRFSAGTEGSMPMDLAMFTVMASMSASPAYADVDDAVNTTVDSVKVWGFIDARCRWTVRQSCDVCMLKCTHRGTF
jgi:hypothetical protein